MKKAHDKGMSAPSNKVLVEITSLRCKAGGTPMDGKGRVLIDPILEIGEAQMGDFTDTLVEEPALQEA